MRLTCRPAAPALTQINFQPRRDEPDSARPSDGGNAEEEATPVAAKPAAKPAGKPAAPASKPSSGAAAAGEPPSSSTPTGEEAAGDDGEFDAYDGSDGPTGDPSTWYSWRNFSVPCFIRPPLSSSVGSSGLGASGNGAATPTGGGGVGGQTPPRSRPTSSSGMALAAATPQGEPQVLHLNIVTCAVNPDLILRCGETPERAVAHSCRSTAACCVEHRVARCCVARRTELPWNANKVCYELDFGPVPVGQRVTRSVELFNQVRWRAGAIPPGELSILQTRQSTHRAWTLPRLCRGAPLCR